MVSLLVGVNVHGNITGGTGLLQKSLGIGPGLDSVSASCRAAPSHGRMHSGRGGKKRQYLLKP
jgi:hypothetical protein